MARWISEEEWARRAGLEDVPCCSSCHDDTESGIEYEYGYGDAPFLEEGEAVSLCCWLVNALDERRLSESRRGEARG